MGVASIDVPGEKVVLFWAVSTSSRMQQSSCPEKSAKNKAINLAIEQIQKQFGKGSIMKLGDGPITAVETIPTGILPLDIALGVGGIPKGRIIEIYGPEASGKKLDARHSDGQAGQRNP